MARFHRCSLTTERTAVAITFVLLLAMASRVAVDPDMWWHLPLGQRVFATGEYAYRDAFSHTLAGVRHLNHSGLGQALLAGFWSLGGHAGLTLFVNLFALGGMACLYKSGRGTIYMQSFVLVFAAACAATFWSPRPQMLTFFFSALLLFWLRQQKRGARDRLWLLPPLMWLWGNCHGGYLVGFLFISAFIVGEALNQLLGFGASVMPWRDIRRLTAAAVVAVALMPLQPLGFDVFAAPFDTLGIADLRSIIQEWKPPNFAEPSTWSFLILLIMLIAAMATSRRKLDCTEFLLLGGALLMALHAARHLSLFAVVATPIITTRFDALLCRKGWALPRRASESPKRVLINLLLIGAVGLATLLRFMAVTDAATVNGVLARNFPGDAVKHLETRQDRGNLFNSYNWGGYLIYHAPQYPVFIDGRTDLYRDLLPEYIAAVTESDAWRSVFTRWNVTLALIETGGMLAAQLDAAEGWRRVYRDDVASLYRLSSVAPSEANG